MTWYISFCGPWEWLLRFLVSTQYRSVVQMLPSKGSRVENWCWWVTHLICRFGSKAKQSCKLAHLCSTRSLEWSRRLFRTSDKTRYVCLRLSKEIFHLLSARWGLRAMFHPGQRSSGSLGKVPSGRSEENLKSLSKFRVLNLKIVSNLCIRSTKSSSEDMP